MKFTGLLFWVQENNLSAKFYKKLGFEIELSDDEHTIVRLGNFQLTLVNMRDDSEFAHDALSSHKGRGAYVYIWVEVCRCFSSKLASEGLRTCHCAARLALGQT